VAVGAGGTPNAADHCSMAAARLGMEADVKARGLSAQVDTNSLEPGIDIGTESCTIAQARLHWSRKVSSHLGGASGHTARGQGEPVGAHALGRAWVLPV
jgi:hypothetical protein